MLTIKLDKEVVKKKNKNKLPVERKPYQLFSVDSITGDILYACLLPPSCAPPHVGLSILPFVFWFFSFFF
jgi:hypothetical protein